MIIVNEESTLGSKGFARSVFDDIADTLIKHLQKSEIEEITNDITFFSELDLSELSQDAFNQIFNTVKKAKNLDNHWQEVLLKKMQADPRYIA